MGANAPAAPSPGGTARKSARRLWIPIGIGILVVLVAAGIVGSLPSSPPASAHSSGGTVTVSTVDWAFFGPGHCFNSTNRTGEAVSAGTDFTVRLALDYTGGTGNRSNCTITSESVGTPGFSIVSANTPLVVNTGSDQMLAVQLTAPAHPELAALTLEGHDALSNQTNSTTHVNVTAVSWAFSGTSHCFNDTITAGTEVAGNDVFTVSVPLSYSGSASCTVNSVATGTTGFTYVDSNTPLTISSGGSQTLNVQVRAPNKNSTGVLDLVASVSPSNHTTRVNVTAVNWDFTGSANCFNDTTSSGSVVSGGSNFTVSVAISFSGPASASCTVQGLTAGTSGFTVISSDTPLVVPSGSTQTLSAQVRAPGENETTVLTLRAAVNESQTSTEVDITSVDWDFNGPSNCWGDLTTKGLNVTGGANFNVTIQLSYTAGLLDPSSCTVQSTSVATAGFTFVGSNTPLVVVTGTTETLRVTLIAPSQNESIVLSIDGTVTSP
jgi:hypothetical protein